MSNEPKSGHYIDKAGRRWFVVVRKPNTGKFPTHIVADSDNGDYTACDLPTFASWGWKPDTREKERTE